MSKGGNSLKCSILVCGLPSGKTSLIKRYINDKFTKEYQQTTNISQATVTVELDGQKVELIIFDSCAKNIDSEVSVGPLLRKDGFIVVYDITDYESFTHTKSFFDAIKYHADRSTLPILVGNKVDNGSERAVSELEAKDFARELNIPYIETSAKDGSNVKTLFETVTLNAVLSNDDVVARKWIIMPNDTCAKCKCVIS